MRVSEVVRQISEEAKILQAHFDSGAVDHEFLANHADTLVAYGLLLRDMNLPSAPMVADAPARRVDGRFDLM
jgi:hypothetical protein